MPRKRTPVDEIPSQEPSTVPPKVSSVGSDHGSISHSSKRMLIAVDRSTFSIESLRKLLHEAGLKHDETIKLLNPMGDADNNYSSVPFSHELYTDKHFHFDKDGVSLVDLIFGQNKIFFVIYSKVLARHLASVLDIGL